MKRTLTVLFGISCLLFADEDSQQKVKVVHTEVTDFPSGGLLRFRNSTGELTVEGWDRPDIEITTVKSMRAVYASRDRERAADKLDQVRISVEHQGESLVITTDFPRHRGLPLASPLRAGTSFDLEYHIKTPMDTRLAVDHDTGEVHVDNLTSDIRVIVLKGGITVRLPQEGHYGIDAKSDFGGATSDFPGHEKRTPWLFGHQFMQKTPDAHELYLRVGFGDITILKIQKPSTPGPLTQ
jgi:hypothetical protein